MRSSAVGDGGNRGYVNDRGKFMDRWRAQDYAVQNDLISPSAPAWAKTSPELIAENLRVPEPVPPPSGLLAYHGSPHKFDAFSDHAIGTGEGAQAYGYGHYLAENEGVARGYRDALAPKLLKWQGEPVSNDAAVNNIVGHMTDSGQKLAMPNSTADLVTDWVRQGQTPKQISDRVNQGAWDAQTKSELLLAASIAEKHLTPNPGHMYEVNVAADPEKFLHWDKPLSEQSQFVRDRLSGRTDWTTPDMTGARLLGEIQKRAKNDPVAASQQLNNWGIPGIRYLDQGSRGAGEGSHNVVVFDPKNLEVIRRYGLAGLMGGGAAALAGGGNQEQ